MADGDLGGGSNSHGITGGEMAQLSVAFTVEHGIGGGNYQSTAMISTSPAAESSGTATIGGDATVVQALDGGNRMASDGEI